MQAVEYLAAFRDARELAGETCHLTLAVVELYRENIRDLLFDPTAAGTSASAAAPPPSLQIMDDKRGRGIWMRGATEVRVTDASCAAAATCATRATATATAPTPAAATPPTAPPPTSASAAPACERAAQLSLALHLEISVPLNPGK